MAKVVLLALAFAIGMGLMSYAFARWVWPSWLEYRRDKERLESELEQRRLERDEKLVAEAEEEYWSNDDDR